MEPPLASGLLRSALFVSVVLIGVQLGVSYAHFMQMNGKLQLLLESYILVQNVLISYRTKLAFIEIPTLVATTLAVFLLRADRSRFILAAIGLACLVFMWLVWFFFIQPINAEIDTWTVATAPPNWSQLRARWHEFHLLRLGLAAVAMCAVVSAALGREAG